MSTDTTTDREELTSEELDREAFFIAAYDELRRLAHFQRRGERSNTLNTTGLVHEAFLRLADAPTMRGYSRAHLKGVVAQVMRRFLVDAARRRNAQKRGGAEVAITFDEEVYRKPVRGEQIEALDAALKVLETIEPRQVRVVELRFFSGLTVEETAEVLGVSRSTVENDWRLVRAWLMSQLQGRKSEPGSGGGDGS
jgi:RNA polymerase sigma factor (TIGR02999 family)